MITRSYTVIAISLSSLLFTQSWALEANSSEINKLFVHAVQAHGSGQFEAAESLYRTLLTKQPTTEAYVNLAVLQSQKGQLENAKASLELALANNPAVWTAYENLNTILAAQASLAYQQALGSNPKLPPLRLSAFEAMKAAPNSYAQIGNLQPLTAKPADTVVATNATPKAAASAQPSARASNQASSPVPAPAPVAAASRGASQAVAVLAGRATSSPTLGATPKPLPRAVESINNLPKSTTVASTQTTDKIAVQQVVAVSIPKVLAQASSDPVIVKVASPASLPAKPEVVKASKPASTPAKIEVAKATSPASSPAKVQAKAEQPKADKPASDAQNKEVERALLAWATAWEKKNLNDYFAAYVANYAPAGKSHSEWKQDRQARIVGKTSIDVKLSGIQVKVDGDKANVTFQQHYQSGALDLRMTRTTSMKKVGDKWLISQENTK